jgi:hypothetical protein
LVGIKQQHGVSFFVFVVVTTTLEQETPFHEYGVNRNTLNIVEKKYLTGIEFRGCTIFQTCWGKKINVGVEKID